MTHQTGVNTTCAWCVQVLQAKTKVANGRIFDLAIKLSQGDLPDQIMKVIVYCLFFSSCCMPRQIVARLVLPVLVTCGVAMPVPKRSCLASAEPVCLLTTL